MTARDREVVRRLAASAPTSELPYQGAVEFVEILNPFGLASSDGVDLNEALRTTPGSPAIDNYCSKCEALIREAARDGKGIIYLLEGATSGQSTPMEYGGYYLEHDRDLLSLAASLTNTILYAAGGEGVYLDFVSDLPAHVFAWDREAYV